MYYVGIDISKYKHDCFIVSDDGEIIRDAFSFTNDLAGFTSFISVLSELGDPAIIRIGFESTAHYALNLELFLEKCHYTFMEFNPVLLTKFKMSVSLRRTKTDAIDCEYIARWLMTVEYKPHPVGFYHTYSLKSLTRLRDSLVRQRSFYMVKITNVLDLSFPEFKPFFKNKFSATVLYILEHYPSAEKIGRMNSASYEKLRCISRGKFSPQKFLELKALAKNSVGQSNDIFEAELKSLLNLYTQAASEVVNLEQKIITLIEDIHPRYMSIPGIGPISAAIIYSEFGDLSRFSSPNKMLAFAGLDPGYYQSGIAEHRGRMVKRGSSHLRYALYNCCLPLIRYDMTFAAYYAKKRDEGKPHKVAMSHVAKKLVRVIYALEKRGVDYDPTKIR